MDRIRQLLASSWASVCLGGILGAFLSAPLVCYPFTYDQGVYADIADAMLRGGVVYRDAWEHKPPGIYYLYYLAFLLIGRDFWTIRVLEALAIGLGSAGLIRTAQRWFGSTPAGVVAALALPIVYLQVGKNSAEPESFQIPLIAWAMACWPIASDKGTVEWRCALSGFLLSLAIMLKTPVATVALVFWLDRAIRDLRKERWRDKVYATAVFSFGLASAPLAILAYYSARGGFAETWDALVLFPLQYNRRSVGRVSVLDIALSRDWIQGLLPISALILLLLGLIQGLRVRWKETVRWVSVFAGAWASMVVQCTGHVYLKMVLIPSLALGMGLVFVRKEPSGMRGGLDRILCWVGGLLTAIAGVQYAATLWTRRADFREVAHASRFLPTQGENLEVIQHVRQRTTPQDRIFIWGNEPVTYFLCDRPIAGPYAHLLPILPPWMGSERLYALFPRLDRDKPRLIIVSPTQWGWDRGTLNPSRTPTLLPEMMEWMGEDYVRTSTFGPHEIWERRS